jgi:hypothetical protein
MKCGDDDVYGFLPKDDEDDEDDDAEDNEE